MFTYQHAILVGGIGIMLLIILFTIVIPILFRVCWNRCGCCRTNCRKCNKGKRKHEKFDEEWVKGGSNTLTESTKYGSEDKEKYSRYVAPTLFAQILIFACIGFIFVLICALTDVPFYVMWIIFFIVWTLLYLDYIRRYHAEKLKKEDDVDMKPAKSSSSNSKVEKFDAYEAAGIRRNSFRHKTRRYLKALGAAINRYKLPVLIGIISIIIISGVSTIFSSCLCVASSPIEGSSYLSRRIGHKYCHEGEICNVYFTLADTANDMIVNFHASEKPDIAFTVYDTISHSRVNVSDVEEWIASYRFRTNATTYKMDTVRELTRYVNWADCTNLTADTTYYFVAVYSINGVLVATEKEYKVKTVPDNGSFTFITGGDMSVDGDGEKLVRYAAEVQPDFAIIGGDNAYDNGFKACYLRWDKWFDRWERFMSNNPGGYSIPMILGIGNHEAGGFGAELGDDPYYTAYFPQKIGLQNQDPRLRLPYHSHRFGVNTTFIILDTNVVVRMDGEQLEWLESQLMVESKLKIAMYHGNIYPSSQHDFDFARTGRKLWAPLFDQYNVTVAFENHLHLYKRTKPIKAGKVALDHGVTYLGDGAWGVTPNIVALSKKDYIERVERKQFFFRVQVQNNQEIAVQAIDKSGIEFPFDEFTLKTIA